jgi:hypothetical protein
LAGCKVDSEASPQFARLRDHWKKNGYPSIEKDVAEAFGKIQKDVQACHWKPMARFSAVLGPYKLFRYRYKNSAAREGARGGWRVIALYDEKTTALYPIIVFPKKELPDADDDTIIKAIEEMIDILSKPEDLF